MDERTAKAKRQTPGAIEIERFDTLARLMERFCALTAFPYLTADAGSQAFFSDFRSYMNSQRVPQPSTMVEIPPDPGEFLAFPTAMDELSLALEAINMSADNIDSLAKKFGILELLHQPIRTLSGGEKALVALAKAEVLEPASTGLVLANPTSWLDQRNREKVTDLAKHFQKKSKPVKILLLKGEWTELDKLEIEFPPTHDVGNVFWRLQIDGVCIEFNGSEFPDKLNDKKITYRHEGGVLNLQSPTIMRGENGIGKSSLAKLLSGVIQSSGSRPVISVSGVSGKARLLFQDTTKQMFGLNISSHMQNIFRYDSEKRKNCDKLFEEIDQELRIELREFEEIFAQSEDDGRPSSVFHNKVGLALERVISKPSLIILDEPSWGIGPLLTRRLVALISREAHRRGVPILIISHEKNWTVGLCKSFMNLNKGQEGEIFVSVGALDV